MRKRSTGLLPFSAESEGERVICPDRAGSEGSRLTLPRAAKRLDPLHRKGMLVAGTFQGTSQIGETQAAQGEGTSQGSPTLSARLCKSS